MTVQPMNDLPPDRSNDLVEAYGQVPFWDQHGTQTLVYLCPQCEQIFRFSTSPHYTRGERAHAWRHAERASILHAFLANVERIPRKLCSRCSFTLYGYDYRITEQLVRGEHLGYFFQAVNAKGANHLLQIRRRNVLYRQEDVHGRWPMAQDHLFYLVNWLNNQLLGIVSEYDRRGTIDDYYQSLAPSVLARIPYDIADGVLQSKPLHWEGARLRVETLSLYPPDYQATLAFVVAVAPSNTATRDKILQAWTGHLLKLRVYLESHPIVLPPASSPS